MYLSRKKYIAPIADKVIVDNSDEVLAGLDFGGGSEMLSKKDYVDLKSKADTFNPIWDEAE